MFTFKSPVFNGVVPLESSLNSTFDPFANLMMMQEARPKHWQSVDLRTLTPFQRALLAIDGTVTKFIEAYTLEPIEVLRLLQQEQQLKKDHPLIVAPKGATVIARQVLLRGRYSDKTYAYAVSLLFAERLSSAVIEDLDIEAGGLGRILLNSKLENRREVLWYGREKINDLPEAIEEHTGHEFISRTYRIIVGNQPIMLISEKFPANSPE